MTKPMSELEEIIREAILARADYFGLVYQRSGFAEYLADTIRNRHLQKDNRAGGEVMDMKELRAAMKRLHIEVTNKDDHYGKALANDITTILAALTELLDDVQPFAEHAQTISAEWDDSLQATRTTKIGDWRKLARWRKDD